MNVNFGLFPPLAASGRARHGGRRGTCQDAGRKRALSARALADLDAWIAGAARVAAE